MKKLLAILLILCLLLSLPFSALAEELPDPGADEPDYEDQYPEPDEEEPEEEEPPMEEEPPIEQEPEEPLPEEDPYAYKLILPHKLVYTVGEEPDFTGGQWVYTSTGRVIPLTTRNSTGLDTSVPGNYYVRVMVGKGKEYFRVVVLAEGDPILKMTDISDRHWSFEDFAISMKAGYFQGNDQNQAMPNKAITRAEMATLIYRAWKKDPNVMVSKHPDAAAPFTDVKKSAWYYEAVEACRKAGILRGNEQGECMPDAPITRQDTVLMLMRIQYTDQEMEAMDLATLIAASGIPVVDFETTASYAQPAMAMALGSIIKGNENGEILPRASISRAECAAIFRRLFLADYEWELTLPEPEENAPLIYLSPSNQFTNPYTGVKANEGDEMNKVAKAAKELLEAKGYRVFIADRNTSIYNRSGEANEMGADIYVPIHSNAGGGVGTRVFYRGDREGSTKLGRYLFDTLAALTNTPFNDRNYKEDYVCLLPDGAPFHELANPNMPVAYLEVEFHDIPEKALWITQNIDALAKAITDGIDAYCKNEMTEVSTLEDSNQKAA